VLETHCGVIVRSDEAAPRVLGVPGGEGGLVGRSLFDLLEPHASQATAGAPEQGVAWRTRTASPALDVALRTFALPEGRALHVVSPGDHMVAPKCDSGRASPDFVSVSREVTAICDAFDAAVEWQQQLLSLVSHELRTPITVIRGYARLLLSETAGPLLDEQRSFLEESLKSCQRLDAFVEELVELSAPSADGDPSLAPDASLDTVLRGVVTYLRPLMREHDAHVELSVSPDADWVRCEPARLEQLVTNLVSNALKHAGAGVKIQIRTSARVEQGTRMVETTVSDDGPGVPLCVRPTLFEPGSRGEPFAVGETSGQGLGLAICKSIVEACGGRIEYRPEGSGGSCFAVLIPASSPEGEPVLLRHDGQEG